MQSHLFYSDHDNYWTHLNINTQGINCANSSLLNSSFGVVSPSLNALQAITMDPWSDLVFLHWLHLILLSLMNCAWISIMVCFCMHDGDQLVEGQVVATKCGVQPTVPSFIIIVGPDGSVKNEPYCCCRSRCNSQSRVGIGVKGMSITMMLVNIGVMCSAGRNCKHIRRWINLLSVECSGNHTDSEDNLYLLSGAAYGVNRLMGQCLEMRGVKCLVLSLTWFLSHDWFLATWLLGDQCLQTKCHAHPELSLWYILSFLIQNKMTDS